MAQREKGGRVVFIGNIPYGVSEEQICDIFGVAGTVVNFRLVYDKETGRPKGFGFLEYTDADAAATAVRNLNEKEVSGRTLRVDYSNDNGGGKGGQGQHDRDDGYRAPPPAHFSAGAGQDGAAVPPLPPGTDLPLGMTAPDAISKTLQTLPPPQLLDILSQMKSLTTSNPAQAQALLSQAPQLAYAIFQALLLLGLVDVSVLGSLMAPGQQMPAQPMPLQQPPPPPMQYPQPGMPPQHQPPPYAQPPQMQQGYGMPPQPPPQHQPMYQQPSYAPTPPVQQPMYQPPQPQAPPPPQQPAMGNPDQQAAIQQVLALSREQIFAMPEPAKSQVIALRAQFGAPV